MRLNVKNTTFVGLLDLLAPHSCMGCGRIGEPLCECCKNNILKQKPELKKTEIKEKIFLVGERNGLLNDLIHDFKYNSNRSLAKPLAELLAKKLPDFKTNVILVPLPTATNHIRARAFDHVLLIAKHLAKQNSYKLEKSLLLRNKNTVQVGADEKTRLKQAEKAFIINENIKIDKNATYLLLDDVWTTGASMKAAIKKLRRSGVKNLAVAILAVNHLD